LSRIFSSSNRTEVNASDPRRRLAELATGENNLSALARMLGRNAAYLRQYIQRGSPRVLPDRERQILADHLGVDEAELGGPAPRFALPRLAVAASAGPGTLVDGELLLGTDTLDPVLARRLGLRDGQAALLRVRGTSMEPTLADGDHVVVRLDDRRPDARGAVYVIRAEGAVMVKRVRCTREGLAASSDHPDASAPAGPLEVLGRVVWRMGGVR
jgi:repressor LexA